MKWKKTIFILLLLAFALTLATGQRITGRIRKEWLANWLKYRSASTFIEQRAGYHIMSCSTDADYGWAVNDTLGRAVKVRFLMNVVGATVKKGDVVVWSQLQIDLVDTVAQASAVDTLTIAISGSTEKSPLDIITTSFSLANACTLEITGVNFVGTATVESIIHTATGIIYSLIEWDSLTQVRFLGGDANDSVAVDAFGQSTFGLTTSDDDILRCGVVFSDSIQDNKWGLIAYEGRMDSVECDATGQDARVGYPVSTSNTTKHCEPRTAATAGDVIGRCLESDNTNGRIAVWLKEE